MMSLSNVVYAQTAFNMNDFQSARKNGDKILLHFHADWCPTCKAQKTVLSRLQESGYLRGIRFYTVDYDKETEFKKEMKVTEQSALLTFYGMFETGRVTGVTDEQTIKSFIDKSLASLGLNDQLRLMKESMAPKVSHEAGKVMSDSIEGLRKSNLTKNALAVGQIMPNFSLPNAHGEIVSLGALLEKGPLIVTFYRGGWCPYCNLQLHSYQQHLAEFRNKGANLVAITPEKPDLTLLMGENKKLEFEILTDKGNSFAKKLGLVFGVSGDLKTIYKQFGVDLEKSQGNLDWQLPVPATYVVSKEGKIIYAFLDVDYTKRADPKELIKTLERQKSAGMGRH
jgi:peroxiredoxin